MNRQHLGILAAALALIGGTAIGMNHLKTHRKLGAPGVNTVVIPGSIRLDIPLPEKVLDYGSVLIPIDTNILIGLPHDTSFAQRFYTGAAPNDAVQLNVVLMGSDRTSMHRPQFCLAGSGWNIDDAESAFDTIRIDRPQPFDLPVMKLSTTREVSIDGKQARIRGIFVYWLVADHDLAARHEIAMWKLATHLLKTGELERWAYVFCFARCLPGEEPATYARLKKFIAAAVPQFQLAVGSSSSAPGQVASAAK